MSKPVDLNVVETTAEPPAPEDKKKDDKEAGPIAPASSVFSAFGRTSKIVSYRFLGIICALVSGSVYPIMAFYFSKSFEKLAASSSDGFLDGIFEMLIIFIILGVVGLLALILQSFFLEIAAAESTTDYKTQWFEALLRQDMAYFDIKDVSSQATVVSTSAAKYKRGTGRKLGEGVQFGTTVLGGFIYAFYASWQTSLVVLAAVPLMAGTAAFMMTVTTKQTERKNKDYAETGGIVFNAISAVRTVFSLNAAETLIDKFKQATQKSYDASIPFLTLVGIGSGGMMASFLVSYIAVTLYGAYLLYDQVEATGCDPSGALENKCKIIGTEVFGALMGISFGAMGLAQIANAVEAFSGARAATYGALQAINRTVEADADYDRDIEAASAENQTEKKNISLPKYVIDSSSDAGKKPNSVDGNIVFDNVSFAYPTRSEVNVFDGFSLNIEAGKTVALVGSSGSGKSTTVSLLERFYDPSFGSITLDGTNLSEINVHWLRDQIGLVSQEPVLFARSIKENIAYGMPGATDEQIIQVAKSANAHDFISKFSTGYDTHVGDKGAQLSGGQKQRIAIARVLLKNPKILLLDEATSALDSESEYVVQEALDGLLGKGNRTTIVIAHRLSTIRNADMIAVVKDGKVHETGSHDELLSMEGSEYSKLVQAQAPKQAAAERKSLLFSSLASNNNLEASVHSATSDQLLNGAPQIRFRDVNFHYPSRPENEIFKGLNLKIHRGETLAIVGPSGGGKSTVVQMIERFYDPLEGSIEYEGTDLKELNVAWYRNEIGFVSQEPTLFNTTIAENIRLGCSDASQQEIEEAAKKANAHDFIVGFPKGYETEVGENATQVSGGQKQRIAIARAIIKKPKILMLDEATSALDTESERIVQEAIDALMESKNQTIIVIAHRLSTIRNADRIAVIANGVLKEIGSHSDLMAKPNGRYKRLVEFQNMKGDEKKTTIKAKEETADEDEDNTDGKKDETEDKALAKVNSGRARMMAKDDSFLFFIGAIGALLAGLVFPLWGVAFADMIGVLFRPVSRCDDGFLVDFQTTVDAWTEGEVSTCEDYWAHEGDIIENESYEVTYWWAGLIASTLIGNVLLFNGFGKATERMNKRVRDAVFTALMQQDITYYDLNSVANLASQIEDDAALIHAFSGQPIRQICMTGSSLLVGIFLAFWFMWPVGLMVLALLPVLGFGAYMEMKTYMGEDAGAEAPKEGEDSAGAIVVETLLSIRTVASLSIQEMRAKEYVEALKREDPDIVRTNLWKGFAVGLGFAIQLWSTGFLFWWGGFLIDRWPNQFSSMRDFNASLFALLFSLSGVSVAAMDAADQTKAKEAANRIFTLIDSKSSINSLSKEGKKEV